MAKGRLVQGSMGHESTPSAVQPKVHRREDSNGHGGERASSGTTLQHRRRGHEVLDEEQALSRILPGHVPLSDRRVAIHTIGRNVRAFDRDAFHRATRFHAKNRASAIWQVDEAKAGPRHLGGNPESVGNCGRNWAICDVSQGLLPRSGLNCVRPLSVLPRTGPQEPQLLASLPPRAIRHSKRENCPHAVHAGGRGGAPCGRRFTRLCGVGIPLPRAPSRSKRECGQRGCSRAQEGRKVHPNGLPPVWRPPQD
mmetsp:Transcript_13109/g.25669  ORF Transcript_13109/g.25669 Transcript_13109/m.25669 type:complete len:253 (+) Transcript_13109:720-1478(+)